MPSSLPRFSPTCMYVTCTIAAIFHMLHAVSAPVIQRSLSDLTPPPTIAAAPRLSPRLLCTREPPTLRFPSGKASTSLLHWPSGPSSSETSGLAAGSTKTWEAFHGRSRYAWLASAGSSTTLWIASSGRRCLSRCRLFAGRFPR